MNDPLESAKHSPGASRTQGSDADAAPSHETELTIPRMVVASYRGRGGKTLATMALLAALAGAGLRPSAFKNGPDFIDPGHHAAVLGRPSRNLDTVLMGDRIPERFYRYSAGSDVALIEGNHGLYDSLDGRSEDGSTAQLAKMLGAPVVLVVDGERTNRTVGALVRGLRVFDPEVRFAAAVLTNVVPRQFDRLTAAVEAEGVPVVGILPRDEEVASAMEYRHLGLVPMEERPRPALVDLVRERFAPRIDTARLLTRAREESQPRPVRLRDEARTTPRTTARIGFLGGRAFTFYYPEILERARELGRTVVLDPESETTVPDLDLLVIGGGFPEVYAESLERNRAFRSAVREYAERGGRIYAECGGLMYLTRSIRTERGTFEMVGLIDGTTIQERRPIAHGYATARVVRDTPIAPKGVVLRGHEFHYSRVELARPYELALSYELGRGLSNGSDGLLVGNVYAHYLHLHPTTYSVLDALFPTADGPDGPRGAAAGPG